MKLKPEELESSNYVLLDTLGHKEIIPFIKIYLKKKNYFSRLYNFANVFNLIFLAFCFSLYKINGNYGWDNGFTHLSYGICMAFLLIPIHEYIHALAYKSQGALQTSYDANLKKFYFMAMADQFVASKKEFQVVALAPFVTISATILLAFIFVSPVWRIALLGTLTTHTAFCSGDFGLLSYFEFHKDKTVITYDDKAKGLSYFLELKK